MHGKSFFRQEKVSLQLIEGQREAERYNGAVTVYRLEIRASFFWRRKFFLFIPGLK